MFVRDTKNEKERQREKSHIIELAAGNLTEIKNIFQPCVGRDRVIRGLPYWFEDSWHPTAMQSQETKTHGVGSSK